MLVPKASEHPSKETPSAFPEQKHHVRLALISHVLKIIRGNEERLRRERSIKPHEKYLILPLAQKITPHIHNGAKRMLRDRLPSDPLTTTRALRYIKILKVVGNCNCS